MRSTTRKEKYAPGKASSRSRRTSHESRSPVESFTFIGDSDDSLDSDYFNPRTHRSLQHSVYEFDALDAVDALETVDAVDALETVDAVDAVNSRKPARTAMPGAPVEYKVLLLGNMIPKNKQTIRKTLCSMLNESCQTPQQRKPPPYGKEQRYSALPHPEMDTNKVYREDSNVHLIEADYTWFKIDTPMHDSYPSLNLPIYSPPAVQRLAEVYLAHYYPSLFKGTPIDKSCLYSEDAGPDLVVYVFSPYSMVSFMQAERDVKLLQRLQKVGIPILPLLFVPDPTLAEAGVQLPTLPVHMSLLDRKTITREDLQECLCKFLKENKVDYVQLTRHSTSTGQEETAPRRSMSPTADTFLTLEEFYQLPRPYLCEALERREKTAPLPIHKKHKVVAVPSASTLKNIFLALASLLLIYYSLSRHPAVVEDMAPPSVASLLSLTTSSLLPSLLPPPLSTNATHSTLENVKLHQDVFQTPTGFGEEQEETPAHLEQEETPAHLDQEETPAHLEQEETPAHLEQEETPAHLDQEETPAHLDQEEKADELEEGSKEEKDALLASVSLSLPLTTTTHPPSPTGLIHWQESVFSYEVYFVSLVEKFKDILKDFENMFWSWTW